MKLTALEWAFAALMALAYVGGLYALIWWIDGYRRRQLHAIFEAIRARGVRTIVVQVEDEQDR